MTATTQARTPPWLWWLLALFGIFAFMALAVTAMIGVWSQPLAASSRRMALVVARPSISGMYQSINTATILVGS